MSKLRVPPFTNKPAWSDCAAIPSSVAKAMDTQFDVTVTAYLSSVQYGEGEAYMIGVIFGDDRKRFTDGSTICTSIIMKTEERRGYLVVHTMNSCYVICDWTASNGKENLGFVH